MRGLQVQGLTAAHGSHRGRASGGAQGGHLADDAGGLGVTGQLGQGALRAVGHGPLHHEAATADQIEVLAPVPLLHQALAIPEAQKGNLRTGGEEALQLRVEGQVQGGGVQQVGHGNPRQGWPS